MNTLTKQHFECLLVSPDTNLHSFLLDLLREDNNSSVDIANNSDQALLRLLETKHPYDMILIDVRELMNKAKIDLLAVIESTLPLSETILIIDRGQKPELESMGAKAFDYLDRAVLEQEFPIRLRQAAEVHQLKEAERKAFILEKLADIQHALAQKKSEEELFALFLAGIKSIGFDRVQLYFFSEDRRFITARARLGVNEIYESVEFPVINSQSISKLFDASRPHLFRRKGGVPRSDADLPELADIEEWGCIPLSSAGRLIGIILVDNKTCRRRIFEADLQAIFPFCTEAMEAIQTAGQAKRIELFHEAILSVTAQEDRSALLNTIITEAINLLRARDSGIYTFYSELNELSVIADHRQPDLVGRKIKTSEGFSESLRHTREPFRIISDYSSSPYATPVYENKKMGAMIEAVLMAHGETISILYVEDEVGRKFTGEDARLLCLFAGRAASALAHIEHEMHLEGLIDSSPVGIIAVKRKGVVTRFNNAAEQILKYEAAQVLGKPVFKLYQDPKEPYNIEALLEKRGGKLSGYKTFVASQDKEAIPISLSATWVYDPAGERVGSVGYFEDLRPAEQIRQKEKHLEILLKASNSITAADNIKDGLNHLAEIMLSLIDGTFCRISLLDDTGKFLTPWAVYSVPHDEESDWDPAIGKPSAISDWPLLPAVLSEGRPVVRRYSDLQDRPTLEALSRRLKLRNTIPALLVVPLIVGNQLIGLLHVGNEDESTFNEEIVDLAGAIGAQTSGLIARIRSQEITARQNRLLDELDEALGHLQDERDPKKILTEFVHQAVELVGFDGGILFINHARTEELEIGAIYGLSGKLPIGLVLPASGPIAEAAVSGEVKEYRDCSNLPGLEPFYFKSIVCLPVSHAGVTEAVLVIGNRSGNLPDGASRDILQRFVARANIVLQTSRLLTSEQRMIDQLRILHKIGDCIQAANDSHKILQLVLTGVTARYGLKFNRAALFLLDETQDWLVGEMAIGQVEEEEAWKAWGDDHTHGLDEFGRYLQMWERGDIRETSVGKAIKGLRLPVRLEDKDAFSAVITERKYRIVEPEELNALPQAFKQKFKPNSQVAIIPLEARDRAIGLLVTDCKFTQSPITRRDIESLLMFAGTAAVAIDNFKLRRQAESRGKTLRTLYKASTSLLSPDEPDRVLQEIVEGISEASKASWVSLVEIDELGNVIKTVNSRNTRGRDIGEIIRNDGNSMKAMREGNPIIIADTQDPQYNFNREMLARAGAAVCLPAKIDSSPLGVMWIHYDKPRDFVRSEIEDLELYVNQAALAYNGARRIDDLRGLREAAAALAKASDYDDVLRQIVHWGIEIFQANSSAVWPYDEMTGKFLPENFVVEGIPDELREELRRKPPLRGGTAETTMKEGIIAVSDTQDFDTPPYLGKNTQYMLKQIGARRFLGIALGTGDETLGVLYLNYFRPRAFRKEEREAAQAFGEHAAFALKRAKLLGLIEKVRNTAKLVAKVTTLKDIRRTLESIVTGTQDVLGCDVVTIYAYYPEQNRLGYPPATIGLNHQYLPLPVDRVLPNPLVSNVLWSEEPIVEIPNVNTHPDFRHSRFARDEGVASCIGVPLRVGDERVGVMFVNYRSVHQFSDSEKDSVEMFSNQAAIAIHNAQLFEKRNRQLEDMESLVAFSSKLLGTVSLRSTLDCAVEMAAQTLGTEFSNIIRPDDMSNDLIFSAAVGWPEEMVGSRFPLKRGSGSQAGFTIEIRKPIIVDDFRTETRFKHIALDYGIHSGLSVPMLSGKEIVGVLLVHTKKLRRFNDEDIQLLSLIANQTAITIQNDIHYEAIEQARLQIQALYEASKAITASTLGLDRRKILKDIVLRAVECLSPKAILGTLHTYHPETKELILESVHPDTRFDTPATIIGYRRPLEGNRDSDSKIGVIGRAIKEKSPQVVDDVLDDADFFEFDPRTRSELSVPLVDSDSSVLGVLNIESNQLSAFGKTEIKTLQALAELAVIAIENAERHEELRKARNTAKLVAKATTHKDLNQTLNLIVEGTQDALGCDVVTIYVYYPEQNRLSYVAATKDSHRPQPSGQLGDVPSDPLINGVLWADQNQKMIEIYDVSTHPDFRHSRFARDEGIVSCVGVPLRVGNERVGVMFVSYRTTLRFSEREKNDLEMFSDQAAIAIHNAQLFEKLTRQLEDMKSLVTFSAKLLGTLGIQHTLDRAIEAAATILQVEFCSLVLPNANGDLNFSAAVGWPEEMVGSFILERGSGSQTGFTIATGEPIIVDDFRTETRFKHIALDYGIHSGLSVPMLSGKEIVGALLVHTTRPRTFQDEEIKLLSLIANQTAIAIQSDLHYEAIEQARLQIQALYEASKAITASTLGLDHRKILKDIVLRAVKCLSSKGTLFGTLHLYNRDTEELTLESSYPYIEFDNHAIPIGPRRSLEYDETTDAKRGVIGRAVEEKKSQLVDDVSKDIDFFPVHPNSRSELAVPLLDSDSSVLGVLNIESDRLSAFGKTELKTLQALAEFAVIAMKNAVEYEKLKEDDKRKSFFISNVSHDLNTPLADATVILDNLILGTYGFLEDVHREKLQEVMIYIQRETQLVKLMLDLNKKSSTTTTLCSLVRVIQEVIREFEDQAANMGLRLAEEFPENDDLKAIIDPLMIKLVLTRLVHNALKYTHTGSVVIQAFRTESEIQICVKDTGIGIPKDLLSKVFEGFYQIGGSLISEVGGFGIGLSIANDYIKRNGGRMWVDSEVDVGSAFWFALPLAARKRSLEE